MQSHKHFSFDVSCLFYLSNKITFVSLCIVITSEELFDMSKTLLIVLSRVEALVSFVVRYLYDVIIKSSTPRTSK